MTKRKAISKKLRFEVFNRDNFTCQYCGKNPNDYDIVLNVDHAVSVKDGGDNSFDNLVTSCWDCNIGKGKKSVIKKIKTADSLKEELRRTKERLEQVKMFNDFKVKKNKLDKELKKEKNKYVFDVLDGYGENLINKVIDSIERRRNKGVSEKIIKIALNRVEEKFSTMDEFIIVDFIKYFNGVIRMRLAEEANPELKYIREEMAKFYSYWNTSGGGSIKYYLINQLKDLFSKEWSFEDVKKYIPIAVKNKYNPSQEMQELLNEDELFYNQI